MAKTLLAVTIFILTVKGTANVVHAAEIKLLSAGGMRPVLADLVNDFERTTGHTVAIIYGTGGATRDRV